MSSTATVLPGMQNKYTTQRDLFLACPQIRLSFAHVQTDETCLVELLEEQDR